jgi:FixJ family two-component response regulator
MSEAGPVADGTARKKNHLVMVLDYNPETLAGLERLLSSGNYRVKSFGSVVEFLNFVPPSVPSCLILDNQLGDGMCGLDVQAEIVGRGLRIPTLFLTSHWDSRVIVQAVRNGAEAFITKPFQSAELLEVVKTALGRACVPHDENFRVTRARVGADMLTKRERQVVRLVCDGLLNKEIADRIGVSLFTVKFHRTNAMRKMGAGNMADLTRLALALGISR